MKKSDLKTGMKINFTDGKFGYVLLNTHNGDIVCNQTESINSDVWFPLSDYPEDLNLWSKGRLIDRIIQPKSNYNYLSDGFNEHVIWERTPEKTYELDGVKYSESTLRSIIKKATE